MSAFTFLSENDKFGTLAADCAPPAATAAATSAGTGARRVNHASPGYKNIRWGTYVPPDQNPALNARSTAAEVPIAHLKINSDQRQSIKAMYHPDAYTSFPVPPIADHIYTLSEEDQLNASAVLAQYDLDVDARELTKNRWSHQWSRHSDNAKVDTRKVLYLCACGYDHHQRNQKYDRAPSDTPGSQKRHTPFPFTACLAHAEITYRKTKILRIRGHFDHNQRCRAAEITHTPTFPVHPSVYVVALAQLRDGASFSAVRQKNRELFESRAYKDFPNDLAASPYRWLLTQNDSRSLYRQYNRLKGVTVTEAPEINVDDWLDPQSDKFNPTLAHAVFHYSARADRGERFEVAIANDDMNHAAWTYGHQSQILLDGTFGICDSRLLLFIVMAVDENRKGVPVAFLLFSAPTGNKQSSSGYDTAILTSLLRKWSDHLNNGRPGVIFKPMSAITDTDLKERGALVAIWPEIWLLICRFHLRQSWRNHRNKLLKGKSAVFVDLKHRMVCLEKALTGTQTISEARQLLEVERQVILKLSVEHPRAARKATDHINYLDTYWTTDNLWPSWSDYGRTVLASMLGIAVDGVIPTTNHLESFNRVFKRTHLRRFQNGGRRLRVDVLVHALVMYILPSIFQERRLITEQANRIAAAVRLLPGGAALLEQKQGAKPVPTVPKTAYLLPDESRDERARELVVNNQISAPTLLPGNVGLTLTSYSSRALAIDTNPTIYTIRVGFNGVVSCTCQDFRERGGACKHIRGALLILDRLRKQGTPIPLIPIPCSLQDALNLQSTILTITIRPKMSDSPTARAAEKVQDILREDGTCFDGSGASKCGDEDDEQDDDSVATDASSDDDSDLDEDTGPELRSPEATARATQNAAALGEQAISRVAYDLEELRPRLREMSGYIAQRSSPLSAEERAKLGPAYGELADFVSKMGCLLEAPHTSPAPPPASEVSPSALGIDNPRKRKQVLPPSPEKQQKRHQSYGVH